MSDAQQDAGPAVRTLLVLSIPALIIGALAAIVLWLLDAAADGVRVALWTWLPDALGIDPDGPWWILGVLTTTGLAVGLIARYLPGHAGPDSATTELVGAPLRLSTLPGLALAVVLGLAGGVSLGPENPIIAINTALVVAALTRAMPKVPPQLGVLLAAAATIGALFGTPVAAALIFTGIVAALRTGGTLWDRLFLPLASAGAGAITMHLLGGSTLAFSVEGIGTPEPIDLLTGTAVAVAAAIVGIITTWFFPVVHRLFHALRNPVLFTTLGGLVLGLLGILGGPITMFKGLEETGELLTDYADYSAGTLLVFALVKVVALLVAASAGFRGGRIFPAVFVGVALGLAGHAILPDMPVSLAVGCGVLGYVIVASHDGWIAIFIAIALTGDIALLPLLCVIVLPVWLLVTRAPEFLIKAPSSPGAPRDIRLQEGKP